MLPIARYIYRCLYAFMLYDYCDTVIVVEQLWSKSIVIYSVQSII